MVTIELTGLYFEQLLNFLGSRRQNWSSPGFQLFFVVISEVHIESKSFLIFILLICHQYHICEKESRCWSLRGIKCGKLSISPLQIPKHLTQAFPSLSTPWNVVQPPWELKRSSASLLVNPKLATTVMALVPESNITRPGLHHTWKVAVQLSSKHSLSIDVSDGEILRPKLAISVGTV